jgi:hypothetical protein
MKFLALILLTFGCLSLSACGDSHVREEVVDLPVGDPNCANGGQKVTPYVDTNDNGVLDDNEIQGKSTFNCKKVDEDENPTE